ncbi:class I SAM-dependent methyltransferase [Archangium violaceum]|uniref:class I SAM-dependent methyltransferase n=1 Tax=Archangium violaceum TaxID=83451 RepID=UPI002B2F863E|nr:class I SAM-dependent methyltransferase [Archangium violaceum]
MHANEAMAHKFGAQRAAVYDAQSTAYIAGYQAMHELSAAAMATALAGRDVASVLCVGVGTGQDVLPYARYGAPGWRFTGVDPSADMLAVAEKRLAAAGLLERTRLLTGDLRDLPPEPLFDGAEMIGVLHHVDEEEDRLALLREVTRRLKPGAPCIIGGRVGSDPVLQTVEAEVCRANGGSPEVLELRRKARASLRPPESEAALFELLGRAGLGSPRLLFASLDFKAFLTRRD